jgi:xylulokinase
MHKLTGRYVACTAGTDTCGLIDLRTRAWKDDYCRAAGLKREKLPDLSEPGIIAGSVTKKAASETGLARGTPVVIAGGDGQVFNVGMAASAIRTTSLTLGTSIVFGISYKKPLQSPIFRTLISSVPGAYLFECVLQSGTYLLRWFLKQLCDTKGKQNEAYWEKQIAGISPGADGLITLPHWWGVRFPENVPRARGATVGWTHHHGRAHLYRSLLEGISFELKRMIFELEKIFPHKMTRRIHAGGGGMTSAVWPSMLADILNIPLVANRENESTALGAAVIAGAGAGCFDSVEQAVKSMVHLKEEIRPDKANARLYNDIYSSIYCPMLESTMRIFRMSQL